MTSVTRRRTMTIEEFDELPDLPGGGKQELVEGRVVFMAPVTNDHGELQVELGALLRDFVRRHKLGRVSVETGFVTNLEKQTVRAPDVAFVAAERSPGREARRRGSLRLAPDLAVEVTSPGDRDADVHRKVEEYLAAGTSRVWVVRPERRTITVHRPGGSAHTHHDGDTLTSDDAGFAVDGLALPLGPLFDTIE